MTAFYPDSESFSESESISENVGPSKPKPYFALKVVLLSGIVIAALFNFNESKHTFGPSSFVRQVDGNFPVALSSSEILSSSENHTGTLLSSLSVEPPLVAAPKIQIVNHIVKAGETLSSLWERYGASAQHAVKVMETLKDNGLTRLGLKKGEAIKVSVAPDGGLLNFEKRLDDGRIVRVTRATEANSLEEGYETEIVPADVEESERTVTGTIQESLAASARSLGLSYALVDDIVDLFSARIRFTKDIQPGDSFTVTFREKRSKNDGMVVGDATLTEASFLINGKLMAVFGQRGSDDKLHFLDEDGNVMGNYFLRYPLTFTRISSHFTYARFHPVLKRSRPHYGVDFSAPTGTPIRSVGDGVIAEMGYKAEPGNWIKIKHNDRWSTAYMHLSAFAPGLKKGMKIARGQLIGKVGATGLATGPHLHFSLYDSGTYVNPLTTDLPQITNDSIKMPKMVLAKRLEAIRSLHEKTRVLASNSVPSKKHL